MRHAFISRRVLVNLGALALCVLTICIYRSAWHGGFIWDDDRYVTNNYLLIAPDGLRRIWLSLDAPSQYFPLAYTILRIERSAAFQLTRHPRWVQVGETAWSSP